MALVGIEYQTVQLREVLAADYGRESREVVAGEIQVLQILQLSKAVRQGHQSVCTDIQSFELSELADVLTRVKILEEGVGVAEEGQFLGSGQIFDLERNTLLGCEKAEGGRAHAALVRAGFPYADSVPVLHSLGCVEGCPAFQGLVDCYQGQGVTLDSYLYGVRSGLGDFQSTA